jgi:hypothetical protein
MHCTKALFASVLFFAIIQNITAQSQLAEITLPAAKIGNIQSFIEKEKVFLFFDVTNTQTSSTTKKCYQINSEGKSIQFQSDLLKDVVVCGVTNYGDDYYLYYLTGKRKHILLKALVYNEISGKCTSLDGEISVEGELLGSRSDSHFSIVLYSKALNQIKFLQLNKLEIQDNKVFDLPFNLTYDYKSISYIPESSMTSIGQSASKYKLYQTKKQLVIAIDNINGMSEISTPQTILMKLNLIDGTQSIHWIKANTKNDFSTFLYKDSLYRLITSKKTHELQSINIAKNTSLTKKIIVRDSTLKDSAIYLRLGKAVRIHKKENLYKIMTISNACQPSIVILPGRDSCELTILWGSYFNEKGSGVFGGINPIAAIITMAITTAIKQMAEPPGLSRYTYMNMDCTQTVTFSHGNRPLRQLIDDYEIELEKNKVFFASKGYQEYGTGALGIYFNERSYKLLLIKFN